MAPSLRNNRVPDANPLVQDDEPALVNFALQNGNVIAINVRIVEMGDGTKEHSISEIIINILRLILLVNWMLISSIGSGLIEFEYSAPTELVTDCRNRQIFANYRRSG